MSVLVKDKKQPYNDNHFYRANPYTNQGYIPTPALRNRKQPQFITQIPQGIDYFEPSAKKHFVQISNKSEIADLHLFQTPERYPLQNSLANDIEYDRNLNTIDIEGANPNTKKNKALRNRIKAQEQLLRRNAPIITPLLATGVSEEERRRKLAEEQLSRQNSRGTDKNSSYRKHHSEKKLLPIGRYIRNPYVQMKDQEIEVDMTALQTEIKMRQKSEQEPVLYSNPEIVTYNHHKNPEEQLGRYQEDQNISRLVDAKMMKHSEGRHNSQDINSGGSRGMLPGSAGSSNLNAEIQQYFQRQRKNIQRQLMSKQLRQINPTNLSYEGSVVRNSSIFANLGKNLALK